MIEAALNFGTALLAADQSWILPVVLILLLTTMFIVGFVFARFTKMQNNLNATLPVVLSRLNTLDKQINNANEGEETLRARVFQDSNRLARIEGMMVSRFPEFNRGQRYD